MPEVARQWEDDMRLCSRLNDWYEHEWQAGQTEGEKLIQIYEIIPDEPCVFVAECDNDLVSEFLIEARNALPYWLEESKKLCETIQKQQCQILALEIQLKKRGEG